MKTLRRLVSSWKNLALLVMALGLFLVSPVFIRWYDPTAGVFDAGFLQAVVLAAFYTFSGGFVGWILWQCAFATLDKLTAGKLGEWSELEAWTKACTPFQKVLLVQGTFIFCIVLFAFNLWLALGK